MTNVDGSGFVVRREDTGEFFAGASFGSPLWTTSVKEAWTYDRVAGLLVLTDIGPQFGLRLALVAREAVE